MSTESSSLDLFPGGMESLPFQKWIRQSLKNRYHNVVQHESRRLHFWCPFRSWGCVTKLFRQPSLPIHCSCSEPLSVANAYKQIVFFSAGVAHSRQTGQARERSSDPIIYALVTISKRKTAKPQNLWMKKRQRKRLSDFERRIVTCLWNDGNCRSSCVITMGLPRCREPVKLAFLSRQGRGNESACNRKERTVSSMELPLQQFSENCCQKLLYTISHRTWIATSVVNWSGIVRDNKIQLDVVSIDEFWLKTKCQSVLALMILVIQKKVFARWRDIRYVWNYSER